MEGVVNMGRTIKSVVKQKSVIRSEHEKDLTIDAEEDYTPALDQVVSLNTETGKHAKHNTDVTTHEIEGVIIGYDADSKVARICTAGKVQKANLQVTIGTGDDRLFERACRVLGLYLV